MNVTVIGAGAWGTTLAALLSRTQRTILWAREPEVVKTISARHENEVFLPGFTLPTELAVTGDLDGAVLDADVVIVAVPSPHVRVVISAAHDSMPADAVVVSVAKGIEASTGSRMTQVIAQVLADHDPGAIGVLAGPNLAREVMAAHPSAACVAFSRLDLATQLQGTLTSDRFRVYTSTDVVGCEVSGAIKNVIAIAAGMADGLGYGMNTKAALVTRGLAELSRLGTALGGSPLTFLGLTGAGDLMATCSSPLSRNRQLGERIARVGIEAASDPTATVEPEGANSIAPVLALAADRSIEMPICEVVGAVLAGQATAPQAVSMLMGRASRVELHGLDGWAPHG